MIDIGANLSHDSFSGDLPEVLAAAREAGVEHIMVTGTSIESSEAALTLAKQYPDYLSATAGIHPHEAMECDDRALTRLAELAQNPRVRALGETGLDFHRNYSPQDVQERSFAAQLELAAELQLPLFLHQRDGHERFMAILEPMLPKLGPVVVHCFTGTEEELRDCIDHDLHVGITGWICDERRGHHLHGMLPLIPENRLMIETDAPYLLPRTIRPKPSGRRNEPANLRYVLETVAECLGEEQEVVAKRTAAVAREFFNIV